MTIRISIIAFTISLCAVIFGAFFVELEEKLYEFQNGPMLIKREVAEALKNVNSVQNIALFGRCDLNISGSFERTLEKFVLVKLLSNKASAEITIQKDASGAYKHNYIVFELEGESNSDTKREIEGFELLTPKKELLSRKEANEYVDILFFPDSKSRKQKKQEIIDLISEVQSYQTTEDKVVTKHSWGLGLN